MSCSNAVPYVCVLTDGKVTDGNSVIVLDVFQLYLHNYVVLSAYIIMLES